MTSPLPPRRRDSRNLADLIRQDRQNLRQLGTGFAGGRNPLARPIRTAAQVDLEDDDAEVEAIQFLNTDTVAVTGPGPVTFKLTYTPVDGSLQVWWGSLPQPPSEWTLSDNVVTIPDPESRIAAGDTFTAYYAYVYEEPDGTADYLTVMADIGSLWYGRLNETSGTTMADSSGNGRNGTYYTNYTLGSAGLIPSMTDTSVTFSPADNNGARAEIPYGSWMNGATIGLVAWITPDVLTSTMPIVTRDWYPSGRCWWFYTTNTGKIGFLFWTTTGGPYAVTGGTTLSAGDMVAASYDGTTAKVYVNGAVDGTLVQSGSLMTSSYQISIGVVHSGTGGAATGYYSGKIQGPAIFSSLSDRDVANLWAAGQ